MNIIAYTYDADHHCIKCAVKRFAYFHTGNVRFNDSKDKNVRVDRYGIYVDQQDSEGNLVHPLFDIDEWQEFDESYLLENPIQYLACGDCHKIIETYEHKE
jgi:hypothetical protein